MPMLRAMADAKKIDPFDVQALEKSLNDSATRGLDDLGELSVFLLYLFTTATTVRRIFALLLARGLLSENGKNCAATKDLNERTTEVFRGVIAEAVNAP